MFFCVFPFSVKIVFGSTILVLLFVDIKQLCSIALCSCMTIYSTVLGSVDVLIGFIIRHGEANRSRDHCL